MKFNKLHLELALVILLVVLMYQKSNFLNRFVEHPLAKLLLLSGVVAIAHNFGRNAGVISGLIAILLFHNLFEGIENKDDDKNIDDKDDDKDDDNDKDSVNSDSETSDNDDDTSKTSNTTTTKTKNDAGDEVIKTVTVSESELVPKDTTKTNADESDKDDTEGFHNKNTISVDKIALEEEMRKPKDSNKDNTPANIEVATNEHEPLAISSEGFTVYR